MRGMSLRVILPSPPSTECHGCSRRAVLQGFAMTAATVLVGCQDDSMPAPDGGSNPATTMCGPNVCLDLNDPLNAALTMVDGSLTINAPNDKILVMRTSATMVQAVSDICTHAGCGVIYDGVGKVLNCPCHGSRFSLTGMVLRGPAPSPLKQYETQLDPGTNLVTILL